jgi:hypothetical protein
MSRYATILVKTTGNINEDRDRIETLKKESKNIVNITILDSDPKLDKAIADISGSSTYYRLGGTNAFMIEVKIDDKTNLEQIKQKITNISNNFIVVEPY